MREYSIGAWMLQKTWKDGDKIYKEVNGFTILNHRYDIGGRGDENLWK